MKVLLDTCIWGPAKIELNQAGHDVIWAGDWPHDPGDRDILQFAADQQRVLITLDKDFGELVFHQNVSHAGIIRLVGFRGSEHGKIAAGILSQYAAELAQQAVLTVEPDRVRIRFNS